jgi:hypothetical protein
MFMLLTRHLSTGADFPATGNYEAEFDLVKYVAPKFALFYQFSLPKISYNRSLRAHGAAGAGIDPLKVVLSAFAVNINKFDGGKDRLCARRIKEPSDERKGTV